MKTFQLDYIAAAHFGGSEFDLRWRDLFLRPGFLTRLGGKIGLSLSLSALDCLRPKISIEPSGRF
jgi:hypothetical protein